MHAVRAISLVAAITLGLGGGCSGGSAQPPGGLPEVTALVLPTNPSGNVTLHVTVADAESDPADLHLEVSRDDGATWRTATVLSPQSLVGLPTSPDGVAVTIVWDSFADIGFHTTVPGTLRATPRGAGGNGTAATATMPVVDTQHLQLAAAKVRSHLLHYGPIDAATLALAQTHDLVVVHPQSGNVSPATIRAIQQGVDPVDPSDDVIVLAYISVGEDLRTVAVSDQDMLLDARFTGDGTGPRIDPRGPDADGTSLLGVAPLGAPTNATVGTRYASFYLDDNSVDQSPSDVGDGLPDRNSNFGGCFVNAGDPAWYATLDAMLIDSADGVPGIRELLHTDTGRGYACDGLFLDTFDTAAPNAYTDASSGNQGEFEWTAPGYAAFLQRLRQGHPGKLVLQNRGLFFFDPRLPQYEVTTRGFVDFVLIESFRLDSSPSQQFDPFFAGDNRYNIAPKLMAEAGRSDGFRALSLGYAEGPGIDQDTLLGQSTTGLQTLLDDIAAAESQGFLHYLTNGALTLANSFARDRRSTDTAAPVWSSTYNDNSLPFPTPPLAPTPRVGIQRADAAAHAITVHWDVALDQTGVGYALYLATAPFDFTNDPTLATATRIVLTQQPGAGYTTVGPLLYANQATVGGLTEGTTYHLCIRAFDPLGHEERNEVVHSATPLVATPIVVDGSFADWAAVPLALVDADDVADSAGADWLEIKVTDDSSNLYLHYTSANAFNLDGSPAYLFPRTLIFVDLDGNPATGWSIGGVGSELLVSGNEMFEQSSSTFAVQSLGLLPVLPFAAVTECELAIPWSVVDTLQPGARALRLVFLNDEVNDFAPGSGFLAYTATR